uniref:HDC16059 n=1 Tax=Drosophila melanogaster TaxID=7227 RepID=Q6IJ33_DROME|nr:TPA_inf: HDC16059 [Drosophila melanogaster]
MKQVFDQFVMGDQKSLLVLAGSRSMANWEPAFSNLVSQPLVGNTSVRQCKFDTRINTRFVKRTLLRPSSCLGLLQQEDRLDAHP